MPQVVKTTGKKGRANPVDEHVGGRVRLRRSLLGMSQEKLAHQVGLTFQQVQKYERGTNRVSASRLYQFSNILQVPVQYFFDDMENGATPAGEAENQILDAQTLAITREVAKMSTSQKIAVRKVVAAMAGAQ